MCRQSGAQCETGRSGFAGSQVPSPIDHNFQNVKPSASCLPHVSALQRRDLALQVDTVQMPPTRKDPKGFQQTQLSGDAVKVSLQDCLACSGCVTSAETVLLEHQSTGELMAALQSDKIVIVSVSPQSRASLGVLHKQSPTETAGRLAHFLKSLGAKLVLDTASSRDIALLEAAQEFIARYTARHPHFASNQCNAPPGTVAMAMATAHVAMDSCSVLSQPCLLCKHWATILMWHTLLAQGQLIAWMRICTKGVRAMLRQAPRAAFQHRSPYPALLPTAAVRKHLHLHRQLPKLTAAFLVPVTPPRIIRFYQQTPALHRVVL